MKCARAGRGCKTPDEDLDPRTAWPEVIGWVKPRTQGGAHGITFPKKTGRAICHACMIERQALSTYGQEGLDI